MTFNGTKANEQIALLVKLGRSVALAQEKATGDAANRRQIVYRKIELNPGQYLDFPSVPTIIGLLAPWCKRFLLMKHMSTEEYMLLIETQHPIDKGAIIPAVQDMLRAAVYQTDNTVQTALIKADTSAIPSHKITTYAERYTNRILGNVLIDYNPVEGNDV